MQALAAASEAHGAIKMHIDDCARRYEEQARRFDDLTQGVKDRHTENQQAIRELKTAMNWAWRTSLMLLISLVGFLIKALLHL